MGTWSWCLSRRSTSVSTCRAEAETLAELDDNRGVMFAFSLLLLWVAGIAFFTAFHPGGVTDPDTGDPAKDPVDVIKFLMVKGGEGPGGTTTGGTTDTAAQPA